MRLKGFKSRASVTKRKRMLALSGLFNRVSFFVGLTSVVLVSFVGNAFAQDEEEEHRKRISQIIEQYNANPTPANLSEIYGQDFNVLRFRGRATPIVIEENGNRFIARDDIHIFSIPDSNSLDEAIAAAKRLKDEYEKDMSRQTGKVPVQTFLALHSNKNENYNRRIYKRDAVSALSNPADNMQKTQFQPFAGFHEMVNGAGGTEAATRVYDKSTLDYFMAVERTLAEFGNFDRQAVSTQLTLTEQLRLAKAANDLDEITRLEALMDQGLETETDTMKTKRDIQKSKKDKQRKRFLIIARGLSVSAMSGASAVGVYLVSGSAEYAYLATAGIVALFQGGLSAGLQAVNQGLNRWYEYEGWLPPLTKAASDRMATRQRAGFFQSLGKQAILTGLIIGGLTAVADITQIDSYLNKEIVWTNLETWGKMGVTGALSLAGKVFYRRKFGLDSWRADTLRLINYRDPMNEMLQKRIFFKNDLAAVLLSVAISTPEMLRQTEVAPVAGIVMLGVVGAGGFVSYVFEDHVSKFISNMFARMDKTVRFVRSLIPHPFKNAFRRRSNPEMASMLAQADELEEIRAVAGAVVGGAGRELGGVITLKSSPDGERNPEKEQSAAHGGGGGCRALFI